MRTGNQHAQAKRDALTQLLQIGLIGVGTGAAGRSLLGLFRGTGTPTVPVSPVGPIRPESTMPVYDEEEKQANSVTGPPNDVRQFFANMLPDITTTTPLGDAWGPSAAIGSAAIGLGGGYKLTDWLLNRERDKIKEEETEAAKADYRKAMADEYSAAMRGKQAGDDLGLNELYDALCELEKRADLGALVQAPYEWALGHDRLQKAKGLLAAAMLATGVGTGVAAYNWTKDSNRQNVLNAALKIRARQRAAANPAPLLLIPGETKDDANAYAA